MPSFFGGTGTGRTPSSAALVAVAATARKRLPDRRAVGDRDAFERFPESAHSVRLSVEYRGDCHTIEHIFYEWLRCELVPEGGLAVDIAFMPDDAPGALSVRAGGGLEFLLELSEGWFNHIVHAVAEAPENDGLFRKEAHLNRRGLEGWETGPGRGRDSTG